ncbi:hypothetical protein [Oceanobacter mangrovi]|uniref:hypothetical protein n=1 Tax=Oceanobacter mangrovi TaxID=2862510 RepID=UPI001C8D38CE|nr:hypothetical protein [Oceanobacter mangrovi]
MEIPWEFVTSFISGALGGLALAALLGKKLLEQLLQKDMEQFRADLTSQANIKLTEHSAALQKDAMLLNIRYGGIYEKQAEALLTIYRLLFVMKEVVQNLLELSAHSDSDRWKAIHKPFTDAQKFFFINRPLIPLELVPALEDCLEKYHSYILEYHTRARNFSEKVQSLPPDQAKDLMVEHIANHPARMKEAIDLSLEKISTLMQQLLGTGKL